MYQFSPSTRLLLPLWRICAMGDTWEDKYFKLILPLLSILTVNLPLAENN